MISLTKSKLTLIARVVVLVFAIGVGFIALYLAIVGEYAENFQEYMFNL